jgi:hypothetical protein
MLTHYHFALFELAREIRANSKQGEQVLNQLEGKRTTKTIFSFAWKMPFLVWRTEKFEKLIKHISHTFVIIRVGS